MDPRERALVALSAALASGSEAEIRRALEAAREAAPAGEVEETILQSYLFLGYPAALRGFALWRDVAGAEAP
ncbi:MAG TPA: carboxymuconolactone decarboxylase family protein, partial [Longimicrobiales bacterium]|nr:carboxymuconolactone decarboxylase family protein [Longimicrobiales bacterium]